MARGRTPTDHGVLRCKACAQSIHGLYQEDLWGGASCARCLNRTGSCIYCGGAARAVPAEEPRCEICRRLAIHDPGLAEALYAEVVDWAESRRMFENFRQPPMELRAKIELQGTRPSSNRLLGMAQKSIWETPAGASVRAERVVVLAGLPAPLFQAVAAHELGHVWIAAHNITRLSLQDEEGFCELLSHAWISERGTFGRAGLLAGIETSRDPIYGDGFRKMKAFERRTNLHFLMTVLKHPQDHPRWRI